MQSAKKRAELRDALAAASKALAQAPKLSLYQKRRKRAPSPRQIVAYDFETTRIQPGTPRPLYITAFGAGVDYASPIRDMAHLGKILETQFLTDENQGLSFVAWNGNRFDGFIIAAAILQLPDYVIRPYLTRTKTLRGLRIIRAADLNNKRASGWEFLDGIAMLGLVGMKLERFVSIFAPEFPKLTGTIDFEHEEFDPSNPSHCEYARRDSEGLYHGMQNAQRIILDNFDEPLGVTMGACCVKIFQANIPADVKVSPLDNHLTQIIQSLVMRGGFCYCVKRYVGPVWKYDINQAYAAAMRECKLPAGHPVHGKGFPDPKLDCYVVHIIHGENKRNKIPFYYRSADDSGRVRSIFSDTIIGETWITSIEYLQLISEGWKFHVTEYFAWGETFNMKDFVDRLERVRMTCEGGPSGPIGTMVKATGNHSYGKTVESLEPIEYLVANDCPDEFSPFYDGLNEIPNVHYRIDEDRHAKPYHQPHIGAWITAQVRMVVRRAALLAPDAWLYADTDCVIFSRDVTSRLDIDPKRYGAWKLEESGTRYRIIAKKVYTEEESNPADFVGPINTPKLKRSAKAMRVSELQPMDFVDWYNGKPPLQTQTQAHNFLSVMSGAEMYRAQRREGTRV